MKNEKIKKICISALFLAMGIVLPYFTMNMKIFGKTFLPMHYPVMLCGLLCGDIYGLVIGLLLPYIRYIIAGAPVIYPTAIAMSIELSCYGFLIGFLYNKSKYKCIFSLYRSLIITMLFGRIVWGIIYYFLLLAVGQKFTSYMFLTSAFVSGLPGIIGQLVLIPMIALMLNKTKLVNIIDNKKSVKETFIK